MEKQTHKTSVQKIKKYTPEIERQEKMMRKKQKNLDKENSNKKALNMLFYDIKNHHSNIVNNYRIKMLKNITSTPQNFWENRFRYMASPLSLTEQQKCENALLALKKAIENNVQLKNINASLVLQGSYHNNTNIRQESDVDLALVCRDSFFMAPSQTGSRLNLIPAPYTYSQFKNDLDRALKNHFGQIKRGNKAFNINNNTYRVSADITPFFDYFHYLPDGHYYQGIALMTDSNQLVINWPDQHYQNGVSKNTATDGKFKKIVRILKTLRYELLEKGYSSPNSIMGFTLESLAWNVRDDFYFHSNLYPNVKEVIRQMYFLTEDAGSVSQPLEINGIKLLYAKDQKWNRNEVLSFLNDVWNYVGFV